MVSANRKVYWSATFAKLVSSMLVDEQLVQHSNLSFVFQTKKLPENPAVEEEDMQYYEGCRFQKKSTDSNLSSF